VAGVEAGTGLGAGVNAPTVVPNADAKPGVPLLKVEY
jgi:hypothetical protein